MTDVDPHLSTSMGRVLDSRDFEVGGGAAAALAGAMAAALAAMVARLSVTHELPLSSETYESLAAEADALAGQLTAGAGQDIEAYSALKAAYALPRAPGGAAEPRQSAIEEGLRHAADVPLMNVRRSARVVAICTELHERSNPAAASDLAVAASLAQSALLGCARNVEVNAACMKDEKTAQGLLAELAAACDKAGQRCAASAMGDGR